MPTRNKTLNKVNYDKATQSELSSFILIEGRTSFEEDIIIAACQATAVLLASKLTSDSLEKVNQWLGGSTSELVKVITRDKWRRTFSFPGSTGHYGSSSVRLLIPQSKQEIPLFLKYPNWKQASFVSQDFNEEGEYGYRAYNKQSRGIKLAFNPTQSLTLNQKVHYAVNATADALQQADSSNWEQWDTKLPQIRLVRWDKYDSWDIEPNENVRVRVGVFE